MNAERLPSGNLLVPRRAEHPDGTIGRGVVEIGPDDPLYAVWDECLSELASSADERR